MAALSPYKTALALGRPAPTHVVAGEQDADRVQAYSTYEDIWNNVPEAFETLLRAGDDPLSRRYLPFVRGLIESTNRYLAVSIETDWTVDAGFTVSDEQMADWVSRLGKLWAREEVEIKLASLKRWTLIKADGLLMISADPAKEEGSRIRLTEIEPEQYFPIYDQADGERITGVYLASIVKDDEGEDIVQRIEYQRVLSEEQSAELNGAPIGSVFYRLGFFGLTGWDDRPGLDDPQELEPVEAPAWAPVVLDPASDVYAGVALPASITRIPVYHFRNSRRGGRLGRFGISEIQGLESILAGIIQNATDEDTAVAMQGLGVYWTDSGKPRDSSGREQDWEIGPASMLELEKDGKVGRVSGVGSVQPMLDHISLLQASGREASAVPDVAVGKIDSQTASSGVALKIEFMPVLAKNGEKEMELRSKLTQLLFDLQTMWYPAYEGWTALPLQPSVIFGDPIPTDRKATLDEITALTTAGIASKEWAAEYLAEKLGYNFPPGMVAAASAEQQAMLDATAPRIEAGATDDPAVEEI